MKKELLKIVFEEQQQDLIEMIVECNDETGTILEERRKSLEDTYKGAIINAESLVVGKKLEIFNFKERCSDFIKYTIKDIQYFDHFKYKVSDFEQAAQKHEFPIEFNEFIYRADTDFIDSVEGVVTIGEESLRGEKNLRIEWSSNGSASISDLRVPEFDLKL